MYHSFLCVNFWQLLSLRRFYALVFILNGSPGAKHRSSAADYFFHRISRCTACGLYAFLFCVHAQGASLTHFYICVHAYRRCATAFRAQSASCNACAGGFHSRRTPARRPQRRRLPTFSPPAGDLDFQNVFEQDDFVWRTAPPFGADRLAASRTGPAQSTLSLRS